MGIALKESDFLPPMRTALFFIFLSLSPAVFAVETAGEPTFSEVMQAAYHAEKLDWG